MRKARKQPTWADCTFASYEALVDCANGKFKHFVWPDEGRFTQTGSFEFNEDHDGKFEPLLIDKISADMMLALHDALNETNQARFKEWMAKGRGTFGALWEMTQERVQITGFKSR